MNKKDFFVSYNKKDKAFPGVVKSSMTRRYPLMGQMRIRDIIVLEKSKNKKGDLFNRLVCDVFHALGFGEPHYNIQKSGREIDMILQHRTEKRVAIVESKTLKNKVGGKNINKFVGSLDVEKGKFEADGSSIIGYFVSKSGFTETALAQEEERKHIRTHENEIVLLGPSEIVRELIQGNVLCSLENAVKQTRDKGLFIM
jgi:restriction endonuclease Mrr